MKRKEEGEEGTKEGDGEDFRLDVVVAASGFKHSEQKVLEEVSCHSSTDTRVMFVICLSTPFMQYMEAAGGGEDLEFLHSDGEEDGDRSTDDEAITSERDGVDERVGPELDASAEDHGLDGTARGSNRGHGGQRETAIIRPSSVDEPLEESARSSTGSGIPSVARSVSVKTGLRNLKVSEGSVPEKGERTPVMSLVNARAPCPGFSVVDVHSDPLRLTPPPLRFTNASGSRSRRQSGGGRSGK